ncbi:MAG: hypothetical protein ACOVJ6_04755 [Pirellulales bacterium]
MTLGASLGATLAPLARADAPPPATLVADAVIPWHADLAAATQAALVSHRPALVVFLAGSSESGAALSRDVFPAAETVALLTACFEPVRVDVDIDPSAARALGITQVPTACIVDGQQRLLARFDCPTTPAAFVAAASRAAQEAATVRAAGAVTPAAAIREQSDFVKQAAQPAPQPTAQPLVAAPAAAPPADTAHAEEPSLPMTPPAWPAEPASRPMPFMPDSQAAAPARSAIEPATTAPNAIASAPAAPWLTAPAAPVAPAAPAAVAASPATPAAPAAPPATPPATPPAAEPEKQSASSQFFAALQKPFTVFSKPKTDAAVTPPATPAPGSAVAATPQPAAAPDPYGSMPLGLEGYCPVSLIDKGTWVEGRAQWGARHRGRTYLFAGAEQQRAFLATPDRYAPALSGDDPVLACDTGKQVAGQRRFGVTYQSRTYLFSSPETRTAFAANPQRYTTRVVIAERPAAPDNVVR